MGIPLSFALEKFSICPFTDSLHHPLLPLIPCPERLTFVDYVMDFSACCELNCVSPSKFICRSPNPQCLRV